jgi:hypothetical protein
MSTHSLPPEGVLAVCEAVYGKKPRAYLLAIRGHRWELGEGLSPKGRENLAAAVDALADFIGDLCERSPLRKKEKPCRKKKSSS